MKRARKKTAAAAAAVVAVVVVMVELNVVLFNSVLNQQSIAQSQKQDKTYT
jgi:hypothetical protein